MNTVIIGAGIGGLTTAIALQQVGIEADIFEAAPELKPVGAGIFMASNAMQVFQHLGIADGVKAAGQEIDMAFVTDQYLNPISTYHIREKLSARYGIGNCAMTRSRLQDALLRNIATHQLHLNKRLLRLEAHDQTVTLHFMDGTSLTTDMVIAADGIHSIARKYVAGDVPLRYSKQTCWRGIARYRLPHEIRNHNFEIWGKAPGLRFGFGPVWENEVYWFSTACMPEGGKDSEGQTIPQLLSLYKDFGQLTTKLIENTEPASIIRSDLHDFKPIPNWWKGRVVLLGDAAHATTPNLGQGGCQAIEDGWVIAQCLKKYAEPRQAFQAYQQYRYVRAKKVVDMSWTFGELTNIRQPWLQWLRNAALRLIPESMSIRISDSIFRLKNLD